MRGLGAIVLAAGGSTRLGQPKQLLRFRGETLVRRVADAATAAGCARVAVVVGSSASRVAAELRGTAAEIVENDEWQRGLGTSIKRGIEYLLEANPELEGVVLLACDQPFVDASVVRGLISEWESSGQPIVASSYSATVGIPVLFDRSCFDGLRLLDDETGAKPLLTADPTRVTHVPFSNGAVDIDTPADLSRLAISD